MEKRTCFKLGCKLGKSATETYEMMKAAYKEDALSRAVAFDWYKHTIRLVQNSRVKTMLFAIFDSRNNIHHKFVPPDQNANSAFYSEVFKMTSETIEMH